MFHPHTDTDRQEMLSAIGVKSIEDLFDGVPAAHRFPHLDLPESLTEMEALSDLQAIAEMNMSVRDIPSFLGAGAYNHYVPAGVDAMLRRGEFYTAYTPYQPEISQGTLQAIFEYQSMIAALTGMDVSNASHYDGATAMAEVVTMSHLVFRGHRKKVVLSPAIHPHYRATLRTYAHGWDFSFVGDEPGTDLEEGPDSLLKYVDEDTAVVIVQYPDFFGRVYDYTALADAVHEAGALFAVSANPMALGLLKPPGEFGADIVTGEGQPLGVPLSYGGPYLGILATKEEYVRSMPGRLVGETTDVNGKRGYVLTLSTREQHIRRERASSNICTNVALMALAATVYMSLVGKGGLREVAELNYHRSHYAADQITALQDYMLWSQADFFNEFVVVCPRPAAEVNRLLLERDVIGGYDLGQDFPEHKNHLMLAVTEMNPKDEIDQLVKALAEVADA